MTDDATQDAPASAAEAESALGTWLQEGRESAGLGVEAVAAALHLDPAVITALEGDDFSALGAPVFVKGHLRALAGHVGLDVDEAMQRYADTVGDSGAEPPELVVQYQQPIRRSRAVPLLTLLAVLAVVAALVATFLLWPRGAETPAAAAASTAEATVASADERVEATTPETGDQPESTNADFASRLAEARERASQSTTAPATAAPKPVTATPASSVVSKVSGLEIRFTAECWFEVLDAEGRRLATGTAAPGDSRRLDGPRPLSVTLGVADAATLILDGETVSIPASARRGRSARLTLR
ncbi:MAG: RodZ domain-containing protein [Pseudomonadota bacterium]